MNSLAQLAEAAEALARVPALAAQRVADNLHDLIEDEFADGRDPYGVDWAELAESTQDRGRFHPPLTDTGALRSTLNVYATGRGAGVSLAIGGAHPALPHQEGWSGPRSSGPARPIFPEHGLPETWEVAIEEAVTDAIDDEIGSALR